MEIRSLENIDFNTLFRGFERAFSDYKIHFEKQEVRSMLARRGYNPQLSFAAFHDGEIVAFTLNGIGSFGGVATAYDTGTGTVKEYRGRGLAGAIFNHSLPFLRDAGIGQYVLEVLQDNESAIAVYRRMGFEVSREFDCYRQLISEIRLPVQTHPEIMVSREGLDFVRDAQEWCRFTPSWQNSLQSLERGVGELTILGATIGSLPVGCCVMDPNTGDVTQLAVKQEYRRRGIATRLLQEALRLMKTDFVKVLNVDADDETLPPFLKSKNIHVATKQFEMLRFL
ncbi:MAG: GNAT family N-acetyltransferase [Bacteroidales bacterium]|nr:GNAT family N-acetyltransferase [Bacteroidales bacterium]